MEELAQLSAQFDEVRTKPRQVTASSSASTRQLPELFRRLQGVLRDRLDGLMVQFKDTEPTFYNEYLAARVVVPVGSRGTAETAVLQAPNAVPTAQAA